MQIIILAAGKGSRMQSKLPKVMHKINNMPMLEYVVTNAYQVTQNLILIYSDHLKPYLSNFTNHCQAIYQETPLGTAHAVSVAKHLIDPDSFTGVIYGDNPLITTEIINNLFEHLSNTNSKATTLAFECSAENQYGRILCDAEGNFQKIIEAKFASQEEKRITLCNSGVMAFAPGILSQYIDQCLQSNSLNKTSVSDKQEFYLTDIIEICFTHGEKISYYKSNQPEFLIGVNTQEELYNANRILMNNSQKS